MFDIPLTTPKTPPKITALSLIDGELVESDDGDLIRRKDHKMMISYYNSWHNYEVTDRYNFMARALASEVETRIAMADKIKSLKNEVRKLKLEIKRNPSDLKTIIQQLMVKLDGVEK